MDAFANNIPEFFEDNNISGGIHFCGAENPPPQWMFLAKFTQGGETGERMFVAPIGTKPNGIGAALFVSTHPDVRVLYDHPKRKTGRSSKVARWHLYEVEV